MPSRLVPPLLLLALCLSTVAAAAADELIVVNRDSNEAVLVDPARQEVIARFPTGKGPHEVAVSPDGRRAYVTNYGAIMFRRGERELAATGNTITVIDLEQRQVAATWDLGHYRPPHGIVVSRDGSRLWVTTEEEGTVVELSTFDGKVLQAWYTREPVSHMLVATPDESKLYVANIGTGSVSVIRRATGEVKSFRCGKGSEGIAVSPDGREVWVANRAANTISIVNVARDTIVATLESSGDVPLRLAFTPSGREVWVTNNDSQLVSVFDARKRKLLEGVRVGAAPIGIRISPDGRKVYVAESGTGKVTVIDAARRKVIGSFATGATPDGLAWVPARSGASAGKSDAAR